ncbi:MAG: FAD binding domain-containing protein [marine benthic group bacterium]|jgi:4-hydroxybenzoyl-CoA reductase subunit beta|nr:FAD binding domain-containing protein [Candidatus Carthagonibacter metallireducens]MCL7967427.1 FAD binding domain-containing protein [Gemmatimonadota bacterium]MCL7990455.1 FAD binding domain-containing protein [Gemmatimonadota bacterium]
MLRLHPYEYHRPVRLDEALDLLDEHGDDAMPIAGGTDLVPNMKHGLFTPGHLVSLGRVRELHGIDRADDGSIRIGAAESLDSVSRDAAVLEDWPMLADACSKISGPQLRRAGTIGGNVCLDTRCTYYNQTRFWRESLGFCLKKDGDVCHVVPGGTRCVAAHSADGATALSAIGARLEIAGSGGERRTVPIDSFFTSDGVWNRRMKRGELLVALSLPPPAPGTRAAFRKLRIRDSIDFPLANVAAVARIDQAGSTESLRLYVSGMGSYPRKVGKVEEIVAGGPLDAERIEGVAEQAFRQCHPLSNITVDAEWRRAMVPVMVSRVLHGLGETIAG